MNIILPLGFRWTLEVVSNGSVVDSETKNNIIPNDGLEQLLRAPFGDVPGISQFYLGLFRGNYIPTPSTKATDIPLSMSEFVDYEEQLRPEWEREFSGVSAMDNINNKAEFTVNQDRTIYGAFLVSHATKGGGDGLLLSCVRFNSPKQVTAGQTIRMSGGITYASV